MRAQNNEGENSVSPFNLKYAKPTSIDKKHGL